ncbi:MAG: hypothetical protein HQK83_15835 [Fibrobacteria bacterium]|nr:hypothetical protein [Fibrobacteria bacterium]
MSDNAGKLDSKLKELAEIKDLHCKAQCSSSHSSGADMQREMQIEELEEEIAELKKQC